jgi:hypothetical protein
MTQNDMKSMDGSFISTKFGKVLFTIVAVFLTFAGPTYIVYGLNVILKVDWVASVIVGLVLFIVGLVMMRYLVQRKIIT